MHMPDSSIFIDAFSLPSDDEHCLQETVQEINSDIQFHEQSNGFTIPDSGFFSDLDNDPAVLEELNNFSYDDNTSAALYLDTLLATGEAENDPVEAQPSPLEGAHVPIEDNLKDGGHGIIEAEKKRVEEEVQNYLRIARANQTADPSDFFIKSFPHPPVNWIPKPTTKGTTSPRKQKAAQEKHHSLGSPNRITNSLRDSGELSDNDHKDGSDIHNLYSRAMVCIPPDNAIAVARSLGIQSAAPLYRKSTERNAVAKDFNSLQISGPLYLTLLAAAKIYMLDDKHPERQGSVGRKLGTHTDVSGISSCCEEFLERGWGERCWGKEAEVYGGRVLQWPLNRKIIVKLTIPLLRRIVSNERQRLYAAQKRKLDSALSSLPKRMKMTGEHLDICDSSVSHSPPDSVISSMSSTPNNSNTPLTQSFYEGTQNQKLGEIEESPVQDFQIQRPLAENTKDQCHYSVSPDCSQAMSRRSSASTSGSTSEECENGVISYVTSQRRDSSATEASIGLSTEATDYETNIKLHIDFFRCGLRIQSDTILSVAIHTDFLLFGERLRSLVADLSDLKHINILGPEGSLHVHNSETLGKVLMDIEDSVWMDGEAKALVELKEEAEEEGTYCGEKKGGIREV